MSGRRQTGIALIAALLVVALAATLAAFIARTEYLALRRLENDHAQAQARQLAQAGLEWAKAVLADDARRNDIDHGNEPWAVPLAPIPAEGGEVGGRIEDCLGRFNLNNLAVADKVSAIDRTTFESLLGSLGLPVDLAEPAARQATRQRYPDVDALARLPGFDGAALATLRPYLCALPERTRLNVNTAPALLLSAALPGLTLEQAAVLAARRRTEPFRSLTEFEQALPRRDLVVGVERFDIASRYFLVQASARFGTVEAGYEALVRRERGFAPALVWRRVTY